MLLVLGKDEYVHAKKICAALSHFSINCVSDTWELLMVVRHNLEYINSLL